MSKKKYLLLGLLIFTACWFLVLYYSKPIVVKLLGTSFASSGSSYLSALQLADKALGRMSCSTYAGCTKASRAEPPEYVWRAYGFSSVYQQNKDPKIKSALDAELNLLSLQDEYSTDGMIPQLVSIYNSTGNITVLGRAVKSSLSMLARYNFSVSANNKSQSFPTTLKNSHRMFPVSVSWGLLEVAKILKQPDGQKLLEQAVIQPPIKVEVFETASNIAILFEKLAETIDQISSSEIQDEPTEYALINQPLTRSYACWDVLNDAVFSKAFQDYNRKKKVVSFFEQTGIGSKSLAEVKFTTFQQILPCIQAIKIIGVNESGLGKEYHHMIQEFLLAGFDIPERPLCDGAGGLLGVRSLGANAFSCHQNIIAPSDLGWAISVLADSEQIYELRAN